MLKITLAVMLFTVNSFAFSASCEFTIEANDMMKYNMPEMIVGAKCEQVKLTLKHVGQLPKAAMGHNWVLSKASDMDTLIQEGAKAGPAKEYTPDGPKVLAKTKLLGGGEQDQITFNVKDFSKTDTYTYFCSFPGHGSLMKGTLKFEPKVES